MNNKILKINVGKQIRFYSLEYGGLDPIISEVIEFLVKAQEEGARYISLVTIIDNDGDVEYNSLQPFICRQETDEEAEIRIQDEAHRINLQFKEEHRQEKAEYERLKAKFE